jgi:hypothetical protein
LNKRLEVWQHARVGDEHVEQAAVAAREQASERASHNTTANVVSTCLSHHSFKVLKGPPLT